MTTFTVAKEEVDGNTAASPLKPALSTFLVPSAIGAGGFTGGVVVTPSQIPLVSLSDAVMNFTASAGKFTVTLAANDELQICDDAGVPALVYKTGSGGSSIVFDKAGGLTLQGTAIAGTITNLKNYAIMWGSAAADCLTAPANGPSSLKLDVAPGATSTSLSVATGIATTQAIYDTAASTIINVGYQLSGSVTDKASLLIDYDNAFVKLYEPTVPAANITSDTIDYTVAMATKDVSATTGLDTVTTTITVSDVAGLKTTGTATVASNDAGAATFGTLSCADIDVATKKIVCTETATAGALINGDTNIFTHTINIDGAVAITEKTFAVTAEYNFANGTTKDRTVANANALSTAADAGSWKYRGTTIYVPLIKENDGANTFIKLQSKENATVRGIILCSDGTSKAVELGTITAGTPKGITSTAIVTALGGACTVNPAGYAATLSITTDKTNVFGYANTVDAAGNSRRIPLSVESGVSN